MQKFIVALLVFVALVAGLSAVPLESEASTRGRHNGEPTTAPPATPAPHHTDPVTQAPTQAPHTAEPTTQPPTQPPTHAPEPTTAPSHGTTAEPWTATVVEGGKEYHVTCHQEGPMAHPGNIHKYIVCEYEADHKHWHITVMPCAIGTRWHQAIKNCIQDN